MKGTRIQKKWNNNKDLLHSSFEILLFLIDDVMRLSRLKETFVTLNSDYFELEKWEQSTKYTVFENTTILREEEVN